jgi:hypothetical protein
MHGRGLLRDPHEKAAAALADTHEAVNDLLTPHETLTHSVYRAVPSQAFRLRQESENVIETITEFLEKFDLNTDGPAVFVDEVSPSQQSPTPRSC